VTEDQEPRVRVTDNRLIDPETGEPRRPATPAAEAAEEAAVTAEGFEVEAKIIELTNDLQRVQAEYANYRRRVERDREAVREMAIGGALAELLPIIDDIDRARQHGELDGAFRTVGESLESAATKLGLERFGAEGDEFDPMQHEAIATESRDGVTSPTVVAVYQSGYRYAGRVLRPARVAVAGTD
jgi:molecular chaperone GrpE